MWYNRKNVFGRRFGKGMKYVDFRKFTDENGARPVYLFEGEETYFRERGTALLKDRFLKDPVLDYTAFDGGALKGDKLKDLVSALSSFSFSGGKRFVKVSEFYPTEKDYENYLRDLFEHPPEDGVLIIDNAGKGKAGCAALSKKPGVVFVDCGRSDEETIKKWIYVTCKRAGVYVDGVTCGKLAAYCVYDMSRIAKETEKLLIYCEAQGLSRLTDAVVDEAVYPDSEYKIYELSNAISRKNYSAFARILGELSSKGFDEISLLNALCYHFRGLYEVSVSGGSDREVAAALGMKEYAVKKSREQAAGFARGSVLRYYTDIYGAVSAVKSGELTPPSALKRVTAKLFFGNAEKR